MVSANGLMSSTDKSKLDGITAGAQPNPGVATTSAAGLMSSTDKTKLDGITAGATANSTDATLLNRANHTGAQAISTITNLQSVLDGKAPLNHGHHTNDISAGTLPLERGGTGQTTEAGMRGVYTGTTANNTAFPIGSYLVVPTVNALTNSTLSAGWLKVHTNGALAYTNQTTSNYSTIAGTWRTRGLVYIQMSSERTDYFALVQRVA